MSNNLLLSNLNISLLPSDPWVYFFKNKNDEILYVGKAKNLQKRLAQYFSPGSVRKQDMVNKAYKIDFMVVNNESEALYLEDNLIKKHKPYYNNMLKADNSYCYIKITNHDFPQILITRDKKNDKATYIGPKHHTQELKKFLQYLRQVFQFRACKDNQFKQWKICSDYYFWLCKWRCSLKNWKITNREPIMNQYKNIINLIISFFKGNTKLIADELKKEINEAVSKQHFEWATKLRDIYFEINNLAERQNVVLKNNVTWYIFKIKKIKNWYVYVLLNFFQWKLIDIIENKILESDFDFWQITSNLESQFNDFSYYHETEKFIEISKFDISEKDMENWILWVNKSIKKITKEEKNQIKNLLEKFIDWYILKNSFQETDLINDILAWLQTRYKLKNFPYRIECIDISHLSWWRISWGVSCFVWWIPFKNLYRKYKIRNKTIDDYKALEEVIERKFSENGQKNLIKNNNTDIFPSFNVSIFQWNTQTPNLLIIDWWKWQLQVIKKLCNKDKKFQEIFSNIDVISLGKWEARKRAWKSKWEKEKIYYFDGKKNIKSIDLIYDQIDKVLIQVRDEAHRFSNYYRKQQMKNEFKR